jgi:hypothetical protein
VTCKSLHTILDNLGAGNVSRSESWKETICSYMVIFVSGVHIHPGGSFSWSPGQCRIAMQGQAAISILPEIIREIITCASHSFNRLTHNLSIGDSDVAVIVCDRCGTSETVTRHFSLSPPSFSDWFYWAPPEFAPGIRMKGDMGESGGKLGSREHEYLRFLQCGGSRSSENDDVRIGRWSYFYDPH